MKKHFECQLWEFNSIPKENTEIFDHRIGVIVEQEFICLLITCFPLLEHNLHKELCPTLQAPITVMTQDYKHREDRHHANMTLNTQ